MNFPRRSFARLFTEMDQRIPCRHGRQLSQPRIRRLKNLVGQRVVLADEDHKAAFAFNSNPWERSRTERFTRETIVPFISIWNIRNWSRRPGLVALMTQFSAVWHT